MPTTRRHIWQVDQVSQDYQLRRKIHDLVAFEIFYYDGRQVLGHSQADWEAADDQGLQIVIWEYGKHRTQEVIMCLDLYSLNGMVKYGSWMRRSRFNLMRNSLDTRSQIFNTRELV